MAKCPPTMWETQVRSLGREDPWRRKWQPTPVFLPGKSHRQRSLIGYSPWGRKESDTTEWLHFTSLHVPYIPGSYAILFFTALDFTSITSHIHNWVLFLPWLHLFILSGVIYLISLGIHLLVSYLFAFSCYSWGFQGKNSEVACHSLLQWTTFCQNSSPWPDHLEWSYMAWLLVSLN